MTRREWDALPEGVRDQIEQHCGAVRKTETPEWGCSSEFSATLYLDGGLVFCKGIQADTPGAWMHRREAEVNPHLPPRIAPRLLWEVEADGWLMLGFEHAPGRHPDLAPYSADLAAVAETVAALRPALTPCPVQGRSLAAHWAGLPVWQGWAAAPPEDLDPWAAEQLPRLAELEKAAPELIGGDTLLHADLQPGNLLISDGAVKVIDWAWSTRGAAWVDPAFMVIRLMAAGHSPESAESWACRVPAWRAAPAKAVTAFAATVLGLWEHKTRTAPRPHSQRLTEVARRWARHRLEVA